MSLTKPGFFSPPPSAAARREAGWQLQESTYDPHTGVTTSRNDARAPINPDPMIENLPAAPGLVSLDGLFGSLSSPNGPGYTVTDARVGGRAALKLSDDANGVLYVDARTYAPILYSDRDPGYGTETVRMIGYHVLSATPTRVAQVTTLHGERTDCGQWCR